jgi:hypothetical protein
MSEDLNKNFINQQIEDKKEEVRQEFFREGAVTENGEENGEYFKLKQELEGLEGDAKLEPIVRVLKAKLKSGNIDEEKILDFLNKKEYQFHDLNKLEIHDFRAIEEKRGQTRSGRNIDEYEEEKIGRSLNEVKNLTQAMEAYMAKMKELEGKGLTITGKKYFDNLRYPTALFGPAGAFSDFRKLTQDMQSITAKLSELEKELPDTSRTIKFKKS